MPALIRALVACGWFASNLFGGIAVHLTLAALLDWAQLGGVGEVIGFFIFWVANVCGGAARVRVDQWLEVLAAPFLMLVVVGLLVRAWPQASVSELLARPPSRPAAASFWPTSSRADCDGGFLGDVVAEHPDSAASPIAARAVVGQIVGLRVTMVLFAGLGVVMTAASAQLVGETVFDPSR